MVVNERPKRKNAGSKMTAIVSKEKQNATADKLDCSSSMGNDKVKVVDSNEETTEAIIETDNSEDEPHIDIFQTPQISDTEVEYLYRTTQLIVQLKQTMR